MPAVPIVAAVAPAVIGAVAKHKAAKKAREEADAEHARVQSLVNQDYEATSAWQRNLFPQFEQIASAAMGPQVTTESFNEMDTKIVDPHQAKIKDALDRKYFQELNAPEFTPGFAERQLAAYNRGFETQAQQERNALMARGGTGDMPLASDRARIGGMLDFNTNLEMQKRDIQRQRRADAGNWTTAWQGSNRSGTRRSEGPANYHAALAAIGATKPIEHQILYRG